MNEKAKSASRKNRQPEHTDKNKESQKSCFTIMPFGGYFDIYYREIYKPAIEEAGLKAHRADDLYRPSNIIDDIWTFTREATVILADLTGRNPNVMYELGLAHSIQKPAILVTESINDVPFDLRSLRVLEYDKNTPNWGESLQDAITKSVAEILESPIKAIPPTFIEVKGESNIEPVSSTDKTLLELRNDLDSLRREVAKSRSTINAVLVEDDFPMRSKKLPSRKISDDNIVTNLVIDDLRMPAFLRNTDPSETGIIAAAIADILADNEKISISEFRNRLLDQGVSTKQAERALRNFETLLSKNK